MGRPWSVREGEGERKTNPDTNDLRLHFSCSLYIEIRVDNSKIYKNAYKYIFMAFFFCDITVINGNLWLFKNKNCFGMMEWSLLMFTCFFFFLFAELRLNHVNVLWNCCRRFSCRSYRRFQPLAVWRGWIPVSLRGFRCLSAPPISYGDMVQPWAFHLLIHPRVHFWTSKLTYRPH